MMAMAAPTRTQTERSAAMRARLVDATIESLLEHGYAHTTAVEICRRAGVTRGALHHHFPSISALFVEVLEAIYRDSDAAVEGEGGESIASLEALVRRGFARVSQPRFKAVIEIWLAARNDPAFAEEVGPAIARMSDWFDPSASARLAGILGDDPEGAALYRLCMEAMIGLALGRAVSPEGRPVAHEPVVVDLLTRLARERDAS